MDKFPDPNTQTPIWPVLLLLLRWLDEGAGLSFGNFLQIQFSLLPKETFAAFLDNLNLCTQIDFQLVAYFYASSFGSSEVLESSFSSLSSSSLINIIAFIFRTSLAIFLLLLFLFPISSPSSAPFLSIDSVMMR